MTYPTASTNPYTAQFLYSDRRSSIIITSEIDSGWEEIYSYDEYGMPGPNMPKRFGYSVGGTCLEVIVKPQTVQNQFGSDICGVGQAIHTVGDWGGRGSVAQIGGGLVAAPFTGGSSWSVSAAGGKGLMLSGYVFAGGQFVQDLASGTDFGATAA